MGYLDDKFTVPPEERDKPQDTVADVTTPPAEDNTQTATPDGDGGQTTQAETGTAAESTTSTETQTPDKFFDEFNTRFSTDFKTEDDVRNILGLQQKIADLEEKANQTSDYAQKIEDYERQIEQIRNNGNAEFLSKPLIRQAFVAQQLLEKYPDKDPDALRQIVMADVSKLSDLDVLIKEKKIDLPTLSETDIREALLDKYGIDPDTKPEEWSSIVKTKIAIEAQSARANIKSLTEGIELPKAVTAEEREQQAQAELQERIRTTEPLKSDFLAFDKFKNGDFEYDVPAEYKQKLPEMFQALFIDAGMEPTAENLETAKYMRDALFLQDNFQKILEIAVKKGQTEIQAKLDEALNNTQPPNTVDKAEDTQTETLPGKSVREAFASGSW